MNMKVLLTCAGCAVLLGAVASPILETDDYTTIPPGATECGAMLEGKSVDLATAIGIAEKVAGGTATSAAFVLTNNAASINVVVVAGSEMHNIVVDSMKGNIMSDEIVHRFPGESIDGEWTETPSGLKYYDIVVGDGALPAGPASTVLVHYTGWLVDGKKFDSSLDRGQPYSTPLSSVIPGWTEGVGSMRVGSKRKLIIPYNLAYGAAGRRGIPPKATLIFDIELLEVVGE